MATDQNAVNAAEATPPKTPRQRSPNFPIIGLEEAVEWTGKMYAAYTRFPVPIATLHKELWKLKEHSSAGNQRIAALRAYGLIELSGARKDRKATVSKSGERIVGNARDRVELLKQAALTPAIFRELWTRYEKTGLPPDNLITDYLKWDRKEGRFTGDAINIVVANFLSTISFAKVAVGDIIDTCGIVDNGQSDDDEDSDDRGNPPPPPPKGVRVIHTGPLPIPLPMGDGSIVIVEIPRMSASTFAFFKSLLEQFATTIVVSDTPSTTNAEQPNVTNV